KRQNAVGLQQLGANAQLLSADVLTHGREVALQRHELGRHTCIATFSLVLQPVNPSALGKKEDEVISETARTGVDAFLGKQRLREVETVATADSTTFL